MRNHAVLCTRPDETHRPDPLGAASTPQCLSARGLYTYGGYVIDRYVRYTLSSCRAAGFVLADQVLKSSRTQQLATQTGTTRRRHRQEPVHGHSMM